MKKFWISLCFVGALAVPMCAPHAAGRPDYEIPNHDNLPSNPNICLDSDGMEYYCDANVRTSAKKKSDTGKVVMIAVASGVVFAGAMYLIFRKKPSENAPGQVKLMEF